MADHSTDRDERAESGDRTQRDVEETRDRADEREPIHDDPNDRLGGVDEALEDQTYPATTGELVDAYGDREVETQDGSKSLATVFEPVDDDELYDSADDARSRIQGLIRRG